MVTAQVAWELQALTGGRFRLGEFGGDGLLAEDDGVLRLERLI